MLVKPFEIVFLLVFVVFFFGLIAYLVVNILKDSFDSIFDCDYYDAIKSNSTAEPLKIFTARISSINWLIYRGFYADVEIYSDFIVFKIFNKALVIRDFSQLKLTGKFTSTLIVTSGKNKIKLPLGMAEYEYIKKFLEEHNV